MAHTFRIRIVVSPWSMLGRCSKGVDPMLDYHAKLIAIDEEADHQIMHGRRFRKTTFHRI